MPERGYAGRRHHPYALTLIVAGHVAALTALAMHKTSFTLEPPNTPLQTENIPLEPPPPIEPPPPLKRVVEARPPQDRSAITVVPPVVPTPSQGPAIAPAPPTDVFFTPGPVGPVDVPRAEPVPQPPAAEPPAPEPRLSPPTSAKPRGNPGSWVTNEDYPASALRSEEQGRTAFRLAVAADGRPSACTVTASSGSRALDDAACRLLMRRARFVAARDADGNAVTGSYANSFLWQIPDE